METPIYGNSNLSFQLVFVEPGDTGAVEIVNIVFRAIQQRSNPEHRSFPCVANTDRSRRFQYHHPKLLN
jgi:hypothetical protein